MSHVSPAELFKFDYNFLNFLNRQQQKLDMSELGLCFLQDSIIHGCGQDVIKVIIKIVSIILLSSSLSLTAGP
jgi:hypothetical protein